MGRGDMGGGSLEIWGEGIWEEGHSMGVVTHLLQLIIYVMKVTSTIY